MLSGKKVLLGVAGSIAAYKATFLVRQLVKAGAEVKVILTPAARDFVTPLTLSTLSKNPVLWEYFDPEDEEGKWNNHVDLGLWADILLIAPATSNTLSKMANGSCDNLLTGVYMSAKCPVYFAPAMDLDMYKHPSTLKNIQKLESYGNTFIPSESGELASGLVGEGRMAEPENIIDFIQNDLKTKGRLYGSNVLVNAGPTHEPIDPVRFIGNHSSGKMGVALAEAAYDEGASVTLVLGPGSVNPDTRKDIQVVQVVTALDMNEACQEKFPFADITILAAAIADYRPVQVSDKKIKKSGDKVTLELVENPDILAGLGKIKKENQFLAGFALETNDFIENAKKKLHKKNCDLIVLNTPTEKGTGFGYDTNEAILIDKNGLQHQLGFKDKKDIAKEILDHIIISRSTAS